MKGVSCSSKLARSAGSRLSRSILSTMAALALLASSAAAQERSWGLGIGLNNLSIGSFDSFLVPTVYVPLMMGNNLMIEPGIGWVRESESDGPVEASNSVLSLGTGLLFFVESDNDGRVYLGPRIGILSTSSTLTGSPDESAMHLRLSGVVGGEFFLKPRFSLGGEVGLSYFKVDEEDPDEESSFLTTTAEFRIRWYFR